MSKHNRNDRRSKTTSSCFIGTWICTGVFLTLVFVCGNVMIAYSHQRLNSLETKFSTMQLALKSKQLRVREAGSIWKSDISHKVSKRNAGDQFMEMEPSIDSGSSYIRWGRMDCPVTARHIYSGFAAGSHNGHTGGGSNFICVKYNLTYAENTFVDGLQSTSFLYGVEWRDNSAASSSLFDFSEVNSNSMYLQSLSCSACLTRRRYTNIMIPGTNTCPNGWNLEYKGYLMSSSHGDKHASEYICVDKRPQAVPGTEGDQNGVFIYVVEADCPYSMPCEPVVDGREFACVVCSM